jgi:predicted DNA-binding protein with PD1-like motif
MHIKILNEQPERTIAAVFDPEEEVSAGLQQIAEDQNLTAARFTGIGALSRVILGFFDLEKRDYRPIEINEQLEVLSLIGNFALQGATKKVHAHIVVGKSDVTAHGGHLLKGWVHPTLELLIVESPSFLARTVDEASGLPLLKFEP